jgi:hypothetical protein
MDYQVLFNISIAAASFLAGFLMKVMWDAIRDLEEKVHTDFVRRDDFKDSIKEIRQDINVIFSKIEATVTLIYKRLEGK